MPQARSAWGGAPRGSRRLADRGPEVQSGRRAPARREGDEEKPGVHMPGGQAPGAFTEKGCPRLMRETVGRGLADVLLILTKELSLWSVPSRWRLSWSGCGRRST